MHIAHVINSEVSMPSPVDNFNRRFLETFHFPATILDTPVRVDCGASGATECFVVITPKKIGPGEFGKLGIENTSALSTLPVRTWEVPADLENGVFRGVRADIRNKDSLLEVLHRAYPFLLNAGIEAKEGVLHITNIPPDRGPHDVFKKEVADRIVVHDTNEHAVCIPKIIIANEFA